MSDETVHDFTAAGEDAGARLDRFLADKAADLSRSRIKALIEAGQLTAGGKVLTDPSAKVAEGVTYALTVPPPEPAIPEAEDIPLDILFEDEHLIVVNKPAGMTVHPAAGNWTGTLVHALLHHCKGTLSGIGGVERPGIVHRIDKDTSGILVVAKDDRTHQGLSKLFAKHDIERVYIAYVRGAPMPREGTIDAPLARSNADRKKMAVVKSREGGPGKDAVTHYRTLAMFGRDPKKPIGHPVAAKVECTLETGRTHQIRAHMAHIGCPLLGDPMYGRGRAQQLLNLDDGRDFRDFRRQALHAAVLGFVHPVTKEELRFEADIPKDMARLEGFLETL